MMKTGFVVVALISLALALPAMAKTHKNTYPIPCSEVWPAVKDTLSNPENYSVVTSDDAIMNASYNVKHAAHVTVTGAVLQRTNHVTLISKGGECEMQVVSNYSGFEHNDSGDFKERVEASMTKLKAATAAQPAKPEAPAK